jgi:hypothetical protein
LGNQGKVAGKWPSKFGKHNERQFCKEKEEEQKSDEASQLFKFLSLSAIMDLEYKDMCVLLQILLFALSSLTSLSVSCFTSDCPPCLLDPEFSSFGRSGGGTGREAMTADERLDVACKHQLRHHIPLFFQMIQCPHQPESMLKDPHELITSSSTELEGTEEDTEKADNDNETRRGGVKAIHSPFVASC